MSDVYHLIGIGGAGMSVVALLLSEAGATVSGSDRYESAVLDHLRENGIDAYAPHGAKPFSAKATIVLSSAIRPDNPELVFARERGQTIIHRSEALAIAARGQKFVAVAGAHGKTTTSAMIAVGLLRSGLNLSYAIGGSVVGVGSGARRGQGVFVAEADESDGSFLNYSPSVAVVTNVEPDHLDHFGSGEGFTRAFEQFVERIEPGGTLICCAEDAGSVALAEFGRTCTNVGQVLTYGRAKSSLIDPDVMIAEPVLLPNSASATLRYEGASTSLELGVTGTHNLLNATAAWLTCVSLGVDGTVAADALATFEGAGRRFELVGEVAGKRVYDDYAHHPTEVQAALEQARIAAAGGRVVAVFQPHLYSRTKNFTDRFAAALSIADEVVLTGIYAAREDPIEGVTSQLIADSPEAAFAFRYIPDPTQASRVGAKLVGSGDVCLMIGAGDIFSFTPIVIDVWGKEEEQEQK